MDGRAGCAHEVPVGDTTMLFRQLYDAASSTYTYLLADPGTRQAVLIDPVFEQHARDTALLRELNLQLIATLDTHCHADHVTGAWLMHAATGSVIGLSPAYGATHIDLPLQHGDVVRFGEHALRVVSTPGHTDGCLTFVLDGGVMAFTGDCLLIRGAGRTDFQHGDAHRMYQSIQQEIFTLPDGCLIWPAHDYEGRTCSTVAEEKAHNPRIGGGAREEDFVGFMRNLALPHPKQIDVALPANLRAGCPEDGVYPHRIAWGPVTLTYAGVPEIDPTWVAGHRGELLLLDVRTPSELEGEFGALRDALNIPLDVLRERLDEVAQDRPVVTVCQTGKRSAMACQILRKAGRDRVANVAGGMVRWRSLGLPS